MQPPSITSDLKELLVKSFVDIILKEARDFFNEKAPDLASKKEKELNVKLQKIEIGEDFYGFKVIEVHPDNSITIFIRFHDQKIKGLPNLKISLARVAFTIERSINLTDSTKDVLKFVKKPYFFILEITLNNDDKYSIALGGGEDERSTISFNQYRAEIKWKDPNFYLRALLASSSKGGMLIKVDGRLPFAIPLGPTGLGLNGIGLLYGEKFAPKFDDFTNSENAIAKLTNADAKMYVEWSKKHNLDQWIAVTENIRVFGISANIVDMGTNGQLIEIHEAGVSYVSFGPTIIFGGKVILLKDIELDQMVGAIDIRTQTLFIKSKQEFTLFPDYTDPEVAHFEGSFELNASLKDNRKTYIAIGGVEMNECKVVILGFLTLSGGAKLFPFQGAAMRAAARVEGFGEVVGFGGGFSLWIEMTAALGWNPILIGGTLSVGGGVWVKIFGQKIGFGVYAMLELHLPAPEILKLIANFSIDLPWPLESESYSVTIFNYENRIPGIPSPPIIIKQLNPLAYIHGPSGKNGALTEEKLEVWPDVMFILPFQRIAGDSSIPGRRPILNRVNGDGSIREAGVDVMHQFSDLKIEKIDHLTGNAVILPDIRGCWLYTNLEEGNERTSQLAIPCIDPLNWQNSFDYTQSNTSQTVERLIFQTFGVGPSENINGPSPSKRFNKIVIGSNEDFWIQEIKWSSGYERGVLIRKAIIEFSLQETGERLPVKKCDIRLIFSRHTGPNFSIQSGGKLETKIHVRDIGENHVEWSFVISRNKAQYAQDLILGNGENIMQIIAIGYVIDQLAEITPPTMTIFTPGDYRLTLTGTSQSWFKGNHSPVANWEPVIRNFHVVHPPLRPYIRYSNQGDERIFGLEYGGWNPNPKGLGFGHYQEHLGLVRFRVGYLSKIYPKLWISAKEDMKADEVVVKTCKEETIAGMKASQEWALSIGTISPKEEEITYPIPKTKGIYSIRVFNTEPIDEFDVTQMIDEWSYRVSEYNNVTEHLLPKVYGLHYLYGPFGVREQSNATPTLLPAGFDIEQLTPSSLHNGWALPKNISNLKGLEDVKAGLGFLQCIEWAGIFDADPGMPGEGILSCPQKADLNLIFDHATSPLGLLLRTSEPCDWRRVEVILGIDTDGNGFKERLDAQLLPSPDGCSCLMIGKEAEGVEVRLQKGSYVLRLRFLLECPNLPRLTVAADPAKKYEEFYFTFNQPYGQNW